MSSLVWEIGFLIIVTYLIFFVAHIEHKNARIEMCKEIGYKYMSNEKCISMDEFNMRYNKSTYQQNLFKIAYEDI